MWASASFVGVLIVIGLPLWWKTTEVYRVALPYDEIAAFDSQSHTITTQLTDSDVLNINITKRVLTDELRTTLGSVADETEAVGVVGASFDLEEHNKLLLVQRGPLPQDVWVGRERVVFFRDAKAADTVAKVLKQWIYVPSVLIGARAQSGDSTRRVRFPPGRGYHVALSVVHPRPQDLKLEFDAEAAVEDYIGSFVDELHELHNFTLKSQWLYLLNFDFKAKEIRNDKSRHFAVREDRLHLLLTSLETRTATQVSELPTVNLALYVVPCSQAPLVIYDTQDKPAFDGVQAFMSPRWGGVVLASPGAEECSGRQPAWAPPLAPAMGAFLAQLRALLGITDKPNVKGAYLEPLKSVIPRRWEVDGLLRIRTLEQITSAERTLQSLAQLLGEIPNIVINDEVGAGVASAVAAARGAGALARAGLLRGAHRTSSEAFLAAETAFTDPSLLALLYFPDDQKYAIYIPLFLPIMFPVVLSLKNLVLWLRGKPPKVKVD
ncbi:unnamed protein product, partial [Iphiclides podalirius]